MRRSRDLEARLEEWGKEYGGGKYGSTGGGQSWLASLIHWHGRAPQGMGQVPLNTAADEVQEAIEALERQKTGFVPACVIRCEYLTPGKPIDEKLVHLRRMGENLGRVGYYQHLRIARVHVAAWLKLPFEELDGAA